MLLHRHAERLGWRRMRHRLLLLLLLLCHCLLLCLLLCLKLQLLLRVMLLLLLELLLLLVLLHERPKYHLQRSRIDPILSVHRNRAAPLHTIRSGYVL
jgi:hypothetical protein